MDTMSKDTTTLLDPASAEEPRGATEAPGSRPPVFEEVFRAGTLGRPGCGSLGSRGSRGRRRHGRGAERPRLVRPSGFDPWFANGVRE